MILQNQTQYFDFPFSKEAELEEAVEQIKPALFGPNRIYLEIKKQIGKKGVQINRV